MGLTLFLGNHAMLTLSWTKLITVPGKTTRAIPENCLEADRKQHPQQQSPHSKP
uniref:Uncharacterized protein n=1 Tax=Rhizophora mucronata TaxID=61149 RepID=A0A2P2R1M3_RHIMU